MWFVVRDTPKGAKVLFAFERREDAAQAQRLIRERNGIEARLVRGVTPSSQP